MVTIPAEALAHTSGRSFEHLNDTLVRSLRTYADRTLVVTADGASYTGEQIENNVARWVAALAGCGVGPGDRVALLSPNRVEVIFAQQAIGLLGAVFVPLHPMGTPADFGHILVDAEIHTVLVDVTRVEEIRQALELVQSPAELLTLGGGGVDDLVELAARETASAIDLVPVDPEEICRIVYTGGTTGIPKAAQVSFRSLSTMYGIQLSDWEWPDELRHLLVAPLSHVGATCFTPTIALGGCLYIENGFDVVSTLAAIERHRITCILLVPTMISAMLDHPRLHEFDVSSLETVLYGAAPISPTRLRAAIEHFGPVFFQFYGQAEAVTTITVLRREEHDVSSDRRLSSCGRPVPEAEVRLLDAGGAEVPDGQPGELCVRGPLLMSGYLNRPEETAEALRGGWLHTGDIAVRDEDGFLRIVDRAKDMIITGGFNVYARVVEDVLESHPSVDGASVFGIPDAHWGELVVAAVVLGHDVSIADLMAHVRAVKGSVHTPKRIEVVDRLPLTPVGKRDKKALQLRFASGTAAVDGVSNSEGSKR